LLTQHCFVVWQIAFCDTAQVTEAIIAEQF
jgi:hypothetical protein